MIKKFMPNLDEEKPQIEIHPKPTPEPVEGPEFIPDPYVVPRPPPVVPTDEPA